MKNDYEIRGEVTAIYLNRRGGNIIETLIDTDCLPKMSLFQATWGAKSYENAYRPRGLDPITKTWVYLYRYLLDAPKNMMVDHIDGNPLNNRIKNLRFATNALNQQNRTGLQHNNSSGIRGVSWSKKEEKWMAKVKMNYKTIWLGYYDNKEEADATVSLYRAMYMPYSQDASNT